MANPKPIVTPFAETGVKNDIPESGASAPQLATMSAGFPTVTQTPINEGGIPPERADFNGLGHLTTSHLAFLNRGQWYGFDANLTGQAGGYPLHARLQLDNGDIARNITPNNTNNPNINSNGWVIGTPASEVKDSDGRNQQEVNTFVSSLLVSPMNFGAVGDGVADDSLALESAINFAIVNNATLDGQGKTYACHSVLFDSNFKFKNANLVCNKFDQDLISVLECSSYNDDPRWLENVYLENIHIDGKRALHTNIKDTTVQEDGGRSGFRFIRPVNGLTMIGCSGVDCASDGIILFPHGDRSSVNDTVKNVELINCKFTGNRRHGGSSNSVNGMTISNSVFNSNGLDINPSAPLNSGLRGDTVDGHLYGSGWDCEEYAPNVQSTNMFFNDCEMKGNAKSGLLFLTFGSPAGTNKAVIEVNNGSYDIGVSDARDNWAILVTPVTDKNYPSTKLFTAKCVNLNGGDIGGLGVDNFVLNQLVNVGAARALELTTMYATGDFVVTAEASSSIVNKTFSPSTARFNYSNNLFQINTSADKMELRGGIRDVENGSFKVSAFRGIERGSLEFKMNVNSGGTDLYYSTLGVEKLVFFEYNLSPTTNNGYALGRSGARYSDLHASNIHAYPSSTNNPVANGEMVFELTSNTQLKIKVQGNDGVIRSTTLTLS